MQLTIFGEVETDVDTAEPFTAADLDEWIALVEASSYDTGWWPNEWAHNGVVSLLAEPFPNGRLTTKELLPMLRRARVLA